MQKSICNAWACKSKFLLFADETQTVSCHPTTLPLYLLQTHMPCSLTQLLGDQERREIINTGQPLYSLEALTDITCWSMWLVTFHLTSVSWWILSKVCMPGFPKNCCWIVKYLHIFNLVFKCLLPILEKKKEGTGFCCWNKTYVTCCPFPQGTYLWLKLAN